MSTRFLDTIHNGGLDMPLLDYLNRSEFDELIEIDLINNRLTNLYHVEGKYFVPIMESTSDDMFRFALDNMIHPDDRQLVRKVMQPDTLLERLARTHRPGVLSVEFRYRLLDGGWRWVEQVVLGGAQHGFGEGIVRVYVFDIQNQKDRQGGMTPAYPIGSDWDELTGLRRKRPFFTASEAMVKRQRGNWCVLAVDIEHFRLFNEWYGHESGDLLLAQMGGLLKDEEGRGNALAGYLGQDNFCLLMIEDESAVERIYDSLHRLVTTRGNSLGFLPALGVSAVEDSVAKALDRAMVAATQAHGNYRQRIFRYDKTMSDRADREYRLLSNFQQGLKNREVYFVLQPQCVASTGAIVGAESLARWKTPNGETIPPDEFVPVLEKYGFITDLDEYIWDGVCAWLHRWIKDGHQPVPVSVNVSRIDFYTINVPDYMEKLVAKYDLPRSVLKIEVTESAYVVDDANSIRDAVQELRGKGFAVLMDDFGSGYSSLNMLRTLNMDVIKLDAQFLHLGRDDRKGVHIIETIVNMTKTMAVPIIAEGVESAEQVNFLEKLGCRYIQGNFFHAPLSVADFEKLISDETNTDLRGIEFYANQQFSVREFMDQNIYSDSMLNNILGAAAFYCWDGLGQVDIVRFNEQFYRLVDVPDFKQRMTNIQQYFHPDDVGRLFDLLAAAEHDRLNGSSGVLGVYRTDGSLGRFFEHFYFLEENENGKIFYGAMQEVTKITDLQNQMRLLSLFASESIVFLRRRNDEYRYQVTIHGMRDAMGLSQEEFERELNSGAFIERLGAEAAVQMRRISAAGSTGKASLPGVGMRMRTAYSTDLDVYMKIDYVHDEYSDVEYILMFRPREEN